MKLKYILLVFLAFYVSCVLAMEPFTVKDIRIEGVQRTEAGTVFSYLPVKVGETMDDDKASKAIKALFATGFFKDVRLEREGDVLVVILQERPAIAQIDFTGNKSFTTEKIKPALAQIGLAEGSIFDRAIMERAEQEIKRQYLSQGKYAAQVKAVASPLERNRVAVRFDIEEGAVAKIRGINIVGNHVFDEDDLKKNFTLTTPDWMTWWTKNDQYSKQKLSADIEALRSFYMNQGYMDFSVDSTQVSITPDKRDIYITISITEGQKYTISDFKLAGEMLLPESELKPLVKIQPGDIFNRQDVTDSSKAIGDRLGNEGYAFANVNAVPEVDKEKRTVAFTFFIDPGRRVYVNRINVTGNTRTRDEVLRREMRQLESSWYSAERIQRSKERLDHLGYFSDVNIETPAVPGSTDQVDVNVNVTEQSTGSIQLGAGLSSSDGVIVGITVNQSNFLGTGNQVNLNLNTSSVNTVYSLSFTDPYYTPDGISRGFDIYERKVDTSTLDIGNYNTNSYGIGVNYGIPLNERDTLSGGLTLDFTTLNLGIDSDPRYLSYCNGTLSGCDNLTLRLNLGWAHDSRDSIIYTKNGMIQKLDAEFGLPGLDQQYYKLTYQQTWFKEFSKYYSFSLNGQAGVAGAYGNAIYPFFNNFYIGGVNSVRGYQQSTLGTHDTQVLSTGAAQTFAIGGTRELVGNVEVYSPIPFLWDNKQFRLSAFMDAGTVWGGGTGTTPGTCQGASDCLRYSTGAAISWQSPFGPIKLVYAIPLNAKPTDQTESIQFQLGTGF